MSTPEGKVKDKIKKVLKAAGAYYHMPVQNGMGSPTLDFVCCFHGAYFAIEAKAPGQKPTPRQKDTMHRIEYEGGGVTFIIDGDTSELERWLASVQFMEETRGRVMIIEGTKH